MSVILGIGLTMAAGAAPPPYYEDRSLKLTLTLPSRDEATLRMAMGQVMVGKVKRVYRTLEDGTRQRVGIGRLDDAELLASMVAITANVRGAEADMVVKDLAGDLIPVTVWWDDRKNFALQRGEPLEMAFDGSLTPASIRQKHEIAEIVDADRTWDHRALQIVDEALSSLSAAELERVRDVPFHRVSAPSEAVLSGLIQGPDQELAAVYTLSLIHI